MHFDVWRVFVLWCDIKCIKLILYIFESLWANNLDVLSKYTSAEDFIFAQEEPRNCGAWFFTKPRLDFVTGKNFTYAGRPEMPTSATGNGKEHKQQMADILKAAFEWKTSKSFAWKFNFFVNSGYFDQQESAVLKFTGNFSDRTYLVIFDQNWFFVGFSTLWCSKCSVFHVRFVNHVT